MNKNELTLHMKKQSVRSLEICIGFAKHLVSAGAWVLAIWIIFEALKMIVNQSPSSIAALATVIDSLKIGSILGYVWGIGATGLYTIERLGKKRAIRKKAQLQKQLEQMEPNRTSSNLTSTGGTPAGVANGD